MSEYQQREGKEVVFEREVRSGGVRRSGGRDEGREEGREGGK